MPDWPKGRQTQASEARRTVYPPDFLRTGRPWKTLATEVEGLTLELRPFELTIERRGWEVHLRPGGRRFRVYATGRALKGTPRGAQPHGRDWSEGEIERGIAHAVARVLAAAGPATTDEIALDSHDFYAANGRL